MSEGLKTKILRSITCPKCGRTSYHPEDVRHRYCGACHQFHDDMGISMRAFTMYRRNVPDATHNALQKNAPDQPQFEGVVFRDGRCAIRWLTAKGSTAVWDSFEDMMAIHGHPEYGSELFWHVVLELKP